MKKINDRYFFSILFFVICAGFFAFSLTTVGSLDKKRNNLSGSKLPLLEIRQKSIEEALKNGEKTYTFHITNPIPFSNEMVERNK